MKIKALFTSLLTIFVLTTGQFSFGMKKELMPMPVRETQKIENLHFDKIVEAAAFDQNNENKVLLMSSGECQSYDLKNKMFSNKKLGDKNKVIEFINENSARPTQVGPYTLCYSNELTETGIILGNKVTIVDTKTETPLYTINHDKYIKCATFNADHTKLITVSNGNNVKISTIKKPIIVECGTTSIACNPDILCASQIIDHTSSDALPLAIIASQFRLSCHLMALVQKNDISSINALLNKLDMTSLCELITTCDYLDITNKDINLTDIIYKRIVDKYHTITDQACIKKLPFDFENMIARSRIKDVINYVANKSVSFDEPDAILSIAVSPNGNHFATGLWNWTANIYDSKTKIYLHTLRGHRGRVTSVAFSPTDEIVATGSLDGTVKIWDKTGKEKKCFVHATPINSIAFSPDGRFLATGSRGKTAYIWDIKTEECLQNFEGHTGWITSIAFSRDGRFFATGSRDKTVRIWDIQTGLTKCIVEHTDSVTSVAFSPNNKSFASASHDKTAKIWDIETGKENLCFLGHEGLIFCVAFSPDGKSLATGSEDKTIKIWDTNKGECLLTLEEHTGSINSLAFSPDGKNILTGAEDHTAKIWCLDNLAKQELLNYLTIEQADFLIEKVYPIIKNGKIFNLVKASKEYYIWMSIPSEAQEYLERYILIA